MLKILKFELVKRNYLSVKILLGEAAGVHEVEEEGPLVHLLHPDDLLGDVLRGGAHSAHRQEHVVTQEVPEQENICYCWKNIWNNV